MPLTIEFCRDRICPNITIHQVFSSTPKQYFTCGSAGPCIDTLDACPENRQPATREELDRARGFELIHLSREWIDGVIKAAEAAEASKPAPLREITIAETETIERSDGVHGHRHGKTPCAGEVEYGAEIVATSEGIIARFGTDGGYIRDSVSATWADVLKHAPARALLEAYWGATEKPDPIWDQMMDNITNRVLTGRRL